MINALRRLLGLRPGCSSADWQPSDESVWVRHVSGPAARYLTGRPGHEFVVERDALSRHLRSLLDDGAAFLGHERYRVMSEWADPTAHQAGLVTDLPYRWRSFSVIAFALLEQGEGSFFCHQCQRVYRAAELKITRSSWGTHCVTHVAEVRCQHSHLLLQSETRLLLRSPAAGSAASRHA